MPFEILDTETKDNMPPTATLSYMRSTRVGKNGGGAGKGKPRLIVTLPTVICIAKSERFVLLLGSGEDAGKLRIKGTKEKRGVKPGEFKSHLMFRFGFVPKLGEDIFDGERCKFMLMQNAAYEIDAPFLKADGDA